tara:strand:+ start:10 stop:462 length:453 start_codon:yes stop_codon:yes gene_type:complete
MPSREILESHPVSVLREEVGKANKELNVIKVSVNKKRLTKKQLIDEMMKHKDRFHHIKIAVKKSRAKTPAPAQFKKAPVSPNKADIKDIDREKLEVARQILRNVYKDTKVKSKRNNALKVYKKLVESVSKKSGDSNVKKEFDVKEFEPKK